MHGRVLPLETLLREEKMENTNLHADVDARTAGCYIFEHQRVFASSALQD